MNPAPIDLTPERVRCIILNARTMTCRLGPARDNWAVARDLFCTGSTTARELCEWAGLDPDARGVPAP